MAAKDTFAQREKTRLDRQLDEELEGTFRQAIRRSLALR
jgi:hypothetical protein